MSEGKMVDKVKTRRKRLKIDKGKEPKRKLTKYRFDQMEPGDSFYYEGSRTAPIISYGYYRVQGEYKTEKEGNGWRFHLLKKE